MTNAKQLSRRDVLRWSSAALGAFAARGLGAAGPDAETPLVRAVAKIDGAERTLNGKVLVEDQAGGVVLLEPDGHWWSLPADILVAKAVVAGESFAPFTSEQLGASLQAELGAGFGVKVAEPYVICTDTYQAYSEWAAELLSRLRTSFADFWKNDELPLKDPEFPLPVLLFANRKEFSQYATKTADKVTALSFGFYSIPFNRMSVFDLTSGLNGRPPRTPLEVNARLQNALGNVTNLVHEAIHQLAYNEGLHTRYSDIPLWFCEGMAIFFEVPDLRSKTGWATMGQPNRTRYNQFRRYRRKRKDDALKTLVRDDARFTSPETATDAYAEAWALTYYLIKERREDYTAYLKHLSKKKMLVFLPPEQRLAEFEQFFGADWNTLDRDFLAYLRRVR